MSDIIRSPVAFILLSVVIVLSACRGIPANQRLQSTLAQMPTYHPEKEVPNHDWYGQELIAIRGYTADAMEVGISPDGRYLLFNDRRRPDKDMHWAERIDERTYQYRGKVRNTVTPTVDGTPSFDAAGNIFFTTLKSYPKDPRSIYVARFRDGVALDPVPAEGNIYIKNRNKGFKKFWVSLDPDISDDGTLLFYSEGCFSPNVPFPYPFNVRGAKKVKGVFVKMDDRILANINTSHMEYAPAISPDGLELFFTRIGKVKGRPEMVGIFTARRKSHKDPFPEPGKIMAITGEVEAPVLSGDEKHLYYHRKHGGRFKVYRVTRKAHN